MLLAWYVGMNLSWWGVSGTFKFTALLGVTVGLVLQCSAGEKHAGSAMNRSTGGTKGKRGYRFRYRSTRPGSGVAVEKMGLGRGLL